MIRKNRAERIRFKAFSVFLAMLMAFSVFPLGLLAGSAADTLRIATLSDIHYFAEEDMGNKDEGFFSAMGTTSVPYCSAILDAALASIEKSAKEKGLKYVIIPGDLTYNGEKNGHRALAKRLEEFEKESGLQVFVANGNHDINNPNATKYVLDEETGNYYWEYADPTTPEEFKEIYHNLGYDQAVSIFTPSAGKAGMLSYSAVLDNSRLIVIDAGKYSADNTSSGVDLQETGGHITDELLVWILDQIAQAKAAGQMPIGMTHWNIGNQNYFTTVALQGFAVDNWQEIAETLADAGMHFVFTGHTHDMDTSYTVSDNGEGLYNLTTCSLDNYPNRYRETVFTTSADGSIKADLEAYDCDVAGPVVIDGKPAASPYHVTSFHDTYGDTGNVADYLKRVVDPMLLKLFAEISDAGLIKYIEGKAKFSLEEFFDNLLHGGLMINNQNIITAKNIMGLLNDLASQIEDKYIKNPDYTIELINNLIDKAAALQISDVPCTKFIQEYGFGSTSRGGTLSDLALSIFVYKANGNEDISDDLFMQDVLSRLEDGSDIVTTLIDFLREEVVDKILIDDILASVDLNLTTFFVDFDTVEMRQFLNVIKNYASGDAVKKIMEEYINEETLILYNQVAKEAFELVGIEGVDILAVVTGMMAMLGDNTVNVTDISLKNIANTLLGYGILDKYGRSLDEVIDYLLNNYVTDDVKSGLGYQLKLMLSSFVIDTCPVELGDFNISYTYSGPVPVEVTTENLRKPTLVAPTYGRDSSTQFLFSWTTKKSVTDSDIEFYPVTGSGFPNFTGTPTAGMNIDSDCEILTREYYGVDIGVLGILPYEFETARHTVTLTNLKPGTTYAYRVGSAERGWWSDIGTFTTSMGNESAFTFFHVTDTQATTPSQYQNAWANVIKQAFGAYSDASFVLHTGDFVDNGDNFKQWQYFFDTASGQIMNTAIMPVSGNHEALGDNAIVNNFNVDYDGYIDRDNTEGYDDMTGYQYTDSGVYYSFDYNNAHFAILNTNDLNSDGTLTKEQLDWLTEDMQNSDKEWKFAAFHKAVYSNGSHYDDDDVIGLRKQLSTLMPELQVDVVFNGHDHVYFRTPVLNNNQVDDSAEKDVIYQNQVAVVEAVINPNGTIYTINGTAGVKSYKGVSSEETKEYFPDAAATYPSDKPIFSAITIEDNHLIFRSYVVDGEKLTEIDSFGIIKDFEELLRGDANLDGYVTSADARLILRFTAKLDKLTGHSLLTGDVNDDGKVNSVDARLVLRHVARLEPFTDPYVHYGE